MQVNLSGLVDLVAHKYTWNCGGNVVLLHLFQPALQQLQRPSAIHVVHEDHGIDGAVIVMGDRAAEPLLPGRVPQLQLAAFPLDTHNLLSEVKSYGGFAVDREPTSAEAEGQAGLANARLPQHNYLECPGFAN